MKVSQQSYRISVHLLAFSILVAFLVYLLAIFHPYSRPVDIGAPMPMPAVHAWVALQAFALTVIGFVVGSLVALILPRVGLAVGVGVTLAGAATFILDVFMFNTIGERFLSPTTAKIIRELVPGIVANFNSAMFWGMLISSLATITIVMGAFWGARFIANEIANDSRRSSAWGPVAMGALMIGVAAAYPLFTLGETLNWMRMSSDRQPIFATALVRHNDRGVSPPTGEEKLRSAIRAMAISPILAEAARKYKEVTVSKSTANCPDVLLVVIESFRHETITEKTTPNLFQLANQGIWCKNHFSTCNSTNMGMFSMFYGLEPTWFENGLNWQPAITKLFHEAGYRTGFFGGSNGWEMFAMQGFVSPQWFDEFQICPVDWLNSDERMCKETERFFSENPGEAGHARQPRLAVLYMFCTHFDYRSDAQDQVHTPALEGVLDGTYAASDRDLVWNRYLNSARFVDRVIGPLLTPDRVVVVAGDHGEAFLEDGCRLHGVRITKYQNMTPAIIAGPNIPHKTLTNITTHTDLLPTILAAAKIEVSGSDSLEGADIAMMDESTTRTMVTRNFIRSELAIIGDSLSGPNKPFGYRAYFSLPNWEASSANPIDEKGLVWNPDELSEEDLQKQTDVVFQQWLVKSYGESMNHIPESIAENVLVHLEASDTERVLKAISIASGVSDREVEVMIPAISKATRHSNVDVRKSATLALITLQRRLARLGK